MLSSTASADAPPPVLESQSVSNLTPTNATLEARINTMGQEYAYEFKLGLSPCFFSEAGCEELPPGTLPASFVGQSVSLDLNSTGVALAPGQTYIYTVVLRTAFGEWQGPWQQFVTPTDDTPEVGPLVTTNPVLQTPPPALLAQASPARSHRHRRHHARHKARPAVGIAFPVGKP
jgi:hypothetical protein